jgi:hypothetical protein
MNHNNFEAKISKILSESVLTKTDLADRIFIKIKRHQRLMALFKTAVYSFSAILSLVLLVIVWRSEGSLIINSEVGSIFSLLFSDTAVVLTYWREFLLSLLEAIPVISVAVAAFLGWLVLASLWLVSNNLKNLIHYAVKRI